MARIFYSLIIFAVFISVSYGTVHTVNGTIKITIGTTSGCSDTVLLFQDLVPVYETYGRFLDIEFVPWGRTRRLDNGNLQCQFGNSDCFANRLHRCALSLLEGDQDAQMRYMTCEFSPPHPAFLQRSLACTQTVGLSLIEVDYCLSTTGDALEEPAQAISQTPMAVINFVPFIVFNNDTNIVNHNQARRRIGSVICFALADDPTTGITNCRI